MNIEQIYVDWWHSYGQNNPYVEVGGKTVYLKHLMYLLAVYHMIILNWYMYNKPIICYIMMNSERQCLTYIGLVLNVRNWNRIMWNDIVLAVSWSYLMCELDDF